MSETLPKGGEIKDSEWDSIGDSLSVQKSLEEGESPEDLLKDAYANGELTPEYLEANSEILRQYGLRDEQYEYFEQLSRKEETPEERRRRFDEEPEQKGYEA